MSGPSTAKLSHASQYELSSSGNSAGRHTPSGLVTCAVRVRKYASGSIPCNVRNHKYKAGLAVARLVDGAAKGDARMRQVDQTGDVPCRAVACCRNVDARSQIRVLVNRNARPSA